MQSYMYVRAIDQHDQRISEDGMSMIAPPLQPHLSVCDSLDAPHGASGDVERADDNEEGGD